MEQYAAKLIENLPPVPQKINIDLVLDSGAFNGSYLVGGLYFLREMEKHKMIHVDRVSGCSIGSLVAFVYLTNRLDIVDDFMRCALNDFRTSFHFKKVIAKLRELVMEPDEYKALNKRLFISFHNLRNQKKIVRSVFKNNEDVIESIIKSCFIPYIINGSLTYEKRFIDGLSPYIFREKKGKQVLFMNLISFDKFLNVFVIKNENNSYTRMLTGLLDVQNFFISQNATPMCSFVSQWSLVDKGKYLFRRFIEHILVFICSLWREVDSNYSSHVLVQFMQVLSKETYQLLLKNYCL
jgi:hypothetical protein